MVAGQLVLFGGPAGAGKSTLAAAWCASRVHGVHVQLDYVRSLIVSGLAEPQDTTSPLQHRQYEISVRASCALALSFLADGYDVALDDVLEPDAVARLWQPFLAGIDYTMVIVIPTLDETLRRSAARQKDVRRRSPVSNTRHRCVGRRQCGSITPD